MKLLLVDGSALLHRAYHAYPSLTTRQGESVGAVYGVISMLITSLIAEEPDKVAVAWDLPQPTFRHELYIGYKAQRVKADAEMIEQIPRVKEVISAMGIVQLEQSGYEADDLIGTMAKKEKGEIIILSGDMDLTQLVSKRVKMLAPARGGEGAKLYGEREVEEKLGVKPAQVVEYKAMVGDASDNIPGISGVGPKTAAALLTEYGDFATVLNNLSKLPRKVREKIEAGRESAELSRQLAMIDCKVKIEVDREKLLYQGLKREELRSKLAELNFRSLIRRIWGEEVKKMGTEQQMGLF